MKVNSNKIKSLFLSSLIGLSSGKEEKTNNQTEIADNGINLNSLPQLAANLTAGGNETHPTLVFAGYPISLGAEATDGSGQKWRKYSTAGFVVVNTNGSECSNVYHNNDYGGFLTSAFGWPAEVSVGVAETSQDVHSWDGLVLLGNAPTFYTTANFYSETHTYTDYTYVSNTEINGTWDTKLTPYVVGKSDDGSFQLYPVTGLGSVVIGSKVCAYGAVSGYNCGNITEINVELTIPAPGNASYLLTMIDLNKIDLGVNGFHAEEDLGGPVYVESNIGGQTNAQALGHITHFNNMDPNHKLLYYTPIDKALERIFDSENCSYALMTHNETHAEKYQELLAQVEIPAKK